MASLTSSFNSTATISACVFELSRSTACMIEIIPISRLVANVAVYVQTSDNSLAYHLQRPHLRDYLLFLREMVEKLQSSAQLFGQFERDIFKQVRSNLVE